ncbi:choline-phosphate cytidylyltransferase [Fusarium oxysporum]|nr:choline-phosphate cytidylyltransferase [Fusarium oxysporum]
MFPQTYVIAGVTADADTARVKGLTVIPEDERALMLRGCKYVDEVIAKCKPVLTPEFMDRFSIDYFAHADTCDLPGAPDPYRFVKEEGKFLVIPRIPSWGSTTEIISRIIRDRDLYIERQLKNGASREEMKV